MPRDLADDYFHTGHWAADGPLSLRTFTCLVCGTRLASWPGFREHRSRCVQEERGADGAGPGAALGLFEALLREEERHSVSG